MKKGFTLIEMLVAIGIFTVIAVAFITILTTVVQVQVQSSSSAAVNQESQFLLQKLQYYVETASLVDIPTSTPTSTLKLELASSSLDPTYITLASGTVYLEQPSGTPQALTSNRVQVSNLSFTRQANPPGHDVVNISYTIAYNTPASDIKQAFSQFFQTSIEQVSAATFDTGVFPSAGNTFPLGSSGLPWTTINGVINFSGSNVGVGIGVISPAEQLSVQGGVQLLSTTPGTCNATSRGTLVFNSPGGASQDALYLCAANASGTLAWQEIY